MMTDTPEMQKKNHEPVADLSFEAALLELEAIVEQLESGRTSLDDAIDAYSRGMSLKAHCQKRLEEARMKVEQIKMPQSNSVGSDGGSSSPTAEPFSSDS